MNGPACPNAYALRSCKRWDCEVCGPLVARDWLTSIRLNLEWLDRPVVVVSVTAPGADVLPWDEAHCSHRRPHKHYGPKGCRVEERKAREWSSHVAHRFRRLCDAARKRVRAAGLEPPPVLERVWELQTRGVPHWHGVLAYGTPAERASARLFVDSLAELAPRWGFGFVDRKLTPRTGLEAARYIAKYFMGRKAGKFTVRETLLRVRELDLDVPRSLLWQSWRELTRHTGCTIRNLRRARHLLAWSRGLCTPPRWGKTEKPRVVAAVLRSAYNVEVRPPPRPATLADYLLASDYFPGGLSALPIAV